MAEHKLYSLSSEFGQYEAQGYMSCYQPDYIDKPVCTYK